MSPADKNIAIFSEQKKSSAFFCQKEEDLLPLFRKMFDGLYCMSPRGTRWSWDEVREWEPRSITHARRCHYVDR